MRRRPVPLMAALPLFAASFVPDGSGPARPASRSPAGPASRAVVHPASPATGRPSPKPSDLDARMRPAGPATDPAHRPARPAFDAPVDDATSGRAALRPASHERDVPVAPASASSVPATSPVPAGSALERTEHVLREAGLAGRFWRGDSLSTSPLPSVPSGFRALDEQLPNGGWPSRCLTELLLAHAGTGEIRFLAATLSSLTQQGREIVLLAPPHIPDPAGWQQLGIDMRRVLIVRAERPADRLWAVEESLRSSAFGALLAWLPEDRALARNDALRRLQSAAASADGLTFLFRPAAAQDHASPAPLRLALAVGQPVGHRRTLSVRLLKRRGPVLARPLTLLLPEVRQSLRPFQPVAADRRVPTSPAIAGRPGSTMPLDAATTRAPVAVVAR